MSFVISSIPFLLPAVDVDEHCEIIEPRHVDTVKVKVSFLLKPEEMDLTFLSGVTKVKVTFNITHDMKEYFTTPRVVNVSFEVNEDVGSTSVRGGRVTTDDFPLPAFSIETVPH
jgi:hypothetical protein